MEVIKVWLSTPWCSLRQLFWDAQCRNPIIVSLIVVVFTCNTSQLTSKAQQYATVWDPKYMLHSVLSIQSFCHPVDSIIVLWTHFQIHHILAMKGNLDFRNGSYSHGTYQRIRGVMRRMAKIHCASRIFWDEKQKTSVFIIINYWAWDLQAPLQCFDTGTPKGQEICRPCDYAIKLLLSSVLSSFPATTTKSFTAATAKSYQLLLYSH